MSSLLYKIILLGIPALLLVGGITLVVWLFLTGRRDALRAKNTVSGLLYIHPANGGGHKLLLFNKNLTKPPLRPFDYKPNLFSPIIPFYFFYEREKESKQETGEKEFEIVPFDIEAQFSEPVITPFEIFEMNNLDWYRRLKKQRTSGLKEALKTGAWVAVAIACLVVAYVLVSNKGEQSNRINAETLPSIEAVR